MTHVQLPRDQWLAGRAKSFLSAGLLITDPGGRLLVLRTSYGKPCWQTPGGGSDLGEDPFSCAVRETFEETSIMCEGLPIELVGIDFYRHVYHPELGYDSVGDPGDMHFFFKGPVMTEDEVHKEIRLSSEHDTWALMSRDQMWNCADGNRWGGSFWHLLDALAEGRTVTMRHGVPLMP